MERLINQLIQQGYLKTPLIIEAFRKIKREDFVPENLKDEANINAPLPIGWGQTISQPLTVAFMLELLQPEPRDEILDIGSGSGWQTAMLAYVVAAPQKRGEPRPKGGGKVFAVERIPELMKFGKENVEKYNFVEKGIVSFICGDGSKGLKMKAPFDKIIVAAALGAAEIRRSLRRRRTAADIIPKSWRDQLKVGGRIVTPIENSIWLLIKKSDKEFEEQEFPGFAFVPLIENK
jgi:protein-L-isoaspartate(D-aspartate) O-methyltransferase